jgi:hypothetical protein
MPVARRPSERQRTIAGTPYSRQPGHTPNIIVCSEKKQPLQRRCQPPTAGYRFFCFFGRCFLFCSPFSFCIFFWCILCLMFQEGLRQLKFDLYASDTKQLSMRCSSPTINTRPPKGTIGVLSPRIERAGVAIQRPRDICAMFRTLCPPARPARAPRPRAPPARPARPPLRRKGSPLRRNAPLLLRKGWPLRRKGEPLRRKGSPLRRKG